MASVPSPWSLDHQLLTSRPEISGLFEAVRAKTLVLDSDRRIVWISGDFLAALGLTTALSVLGRRPGEVLGCVHSHESLKGCGSSEACYLCGAVGAILESRRQGRRIVGTGVLEVGSPSGPQNLGYELSAAPWVLADRHFTVVTFS